MEAKPGSEAPRPSLKSWAARSSACSKGIWSWWASRFRKKSPDVSAFLLAGVSLILGLLVLVGLSAAIVIAFWETDRMAAILTLCAIYAVIMIICISRAISLAKKCAAPFQATLEELERNRERLLP